MSFTYLRTIRFQDTDAAGVVYFANVLSMCHEAYEASLAKAGIDLKTFFSRGATVIPIVHANVDFLQPMFCGEEYSIQVQPILLKPYKFEIQYAIALSNTPDELASKANTIHVCIDSATRSRTDLPAAMLNWLQ